ncbi:MAG: endolytic transglycosylase MltG [Myxococcaceae bacterium]
MKRWLVILGILLFVVAAAGGAIVLWRERQLVTFSSAPYTAVADDTETLVLVASGTGPRRLATQLHAAGVVRDADLTYRWIRHEALGPKLQAGEYGFKGALTPRQVLEKIVNGEVKTYRFTIPEGLRLDEILPLLTSSELRLDAKELETLTDDAAFLETLGIPAGTLEGFLFPDTYTFTKPFTPDSVLKKMVSRAMEEYKTADAQRKPGVRLGLLQTFTLASIVEKETGAVEERPRISCVFHNRLRQRMKLQTDPTVLYATMLVRGRFVKNITSKDLVTDHPYNTYTRTGLPPGPIASPGAAALRATLAPLDCEDLFFVSRNDGTHVFCPTLKCHEAAVEEWQRRFFRKSPATKRSGGKKRKR